MTYEQAINSKLKGTLNQIDTFGLATFESLNDEGLQMSFDNFLTLFRRNWTKTNKKRFIVKVQCKDGYWMGDSFFTKPEAKEHLKQSVDDSIIGAYIFDTTFNVVYVPTQFQTSFKLDGMPIVDKDLVFPEVLKRIVEPLIF